MCEFGDRTARPTATPPDADRSGPTRVTHDHTRPHRTSRYMRRVISRPLPDTRPGSSHPGRDRSDATAISLRKLCEVRYPGAGSEGEAHRAARRVCADVSGSLRHGDCSSQSFAQTDLRPTADSPGEVRVQGRTCNPNPEIWEFEILAPSKFRDVEIPRFQQMSEIWEM